MKKTGTVYPGIQGRFKEPAAWAWDWFVNKMGASLRWGQLKATGESRGTAYILLGQVSFIEGFFETYRDLSRMGFDVVVLDRHGEGGSARCQENPQRPSGLYHKHHIDDLYQLITNIRPPTKNRPVLLMGACLGGLIGMQYACKHPDTIDHLLLITPYLGRSTKSGNFKNSFNHSSRFLAKTGYLPGAADWSWEDAISAYEERPVTHDYDRFLNLQLWQKHNPFLRSGGLTYEHMHTINCGIETVDRPDFRDSYTTPTTIIAASADKISCPHKQRIVADGLPDCTYFLVEDGYHNLAIEADIWRDQMFAVIEDITPVCFSKTVKNESYCSHHHNPP